MKSSVEAEPPIAAFIPGPPPWLPPEMRPKATITTEGIEEIVDRCVGDAMTAADTPGASVAVVVDGEVWIEDGGRLLLHLWDPNSAWSEVWILDRVALDVFLVDLEGDGIHDLDLSSLLSGGAPERLRWMRMRPAVGSLQVVPRGGRRVVP